MKMKEGKMTGKESASVAGRKAHEGVL